MTLDPDTRALSVLLAGLRALDEQWAVDEDEMADPTNDLLYARSLRSDRERRAAVSPTENRGSASAASPGALGGYMTSTPS